MRTLCKSSLALLLGLLVTGVYGQEGPWQPASGTPAAGPAPAVRLDRPIARTPPSPAPTSTAPAAGLAAVLGRPIAIAVSTPGPNAIRPASFSPTPVFRGQVPDNPVRPMPVGAPLADPGQSLHSWRPAEDPRVPVAVTPGAPLAGPGLVGPPVVPGPSLFASNGPGAPPCPPCPTCGDCAPCSDCCWDGCGKGHCCATNHFYGSAEYLLWWVRGQSLPPLVTTTGANVFNFGSGPPFNGALGTPGTSVLIGNNTVGSGPLSGLRGTIGYWFGDCHLVGAELGGFFLGRTSNRFSAESLGDVTLGRPFFDTNPFNPVPNVQATAGLVQSAGPLGTQLLAGRIDVNTSTSLWGYEANLRTNLVCCPHYTLDLLGGFRSLGLDEKLNVTERLMFLNDVINTTTGQIVVPQGTRFALSDSFHTQNRFYGAQLGLNNEFRYNHWSVGLWGKLAMGTTQQIVDISGVTATRFPAGTPQAAMNGNFLGGLLAQPTNIGRFSHNSFTVVPEVGLNVGYQVTQHMRCFVGYNFLYWSSVVRPGNQVDLLVDSRLLAKPTPPLSPAPTHPAFQFNGSDFWTQGLTFGIEFRY
jgi:hypothetical protein